MSDEDMMKAIADTSGPKQVAPGRVRRLSKKKKVVADKSKAKGFGSRAQRELASL